MPEEQNAVRRARRRLNRIEETGATFLITDLDVASRTQANARHAYDDVSRISHHALLAADDRQTVDEKLVELRSALEQLGEVFP